MTETIRYDLFILYADDDAEWVEDILLPSLAIPRDRILTREQFRVGVDKIIVFEQAIASSRYTLLILSRSFFNDVWAQYGGTIASYSRITSQQNNLLPLVLHPCDLPQYFAQIEAIDCTKTGWQKELERLRNSLNQPESPLPFLDQQKLSFQFPTESNRRGTFDNKRIISLLEEQAFYLNIHFSPEALLEQVYFASANLHSWPNNFFKGCPPLERKEVHQIMDWIHQPLSDKHSSVVIVTGKAGAGKSVILRGVLENLREGQIPVLGIKTDEQQDIHALDLPEGVKATLIALIRHYGKAVVLFDQIDALSQSSSSNRQALNAYLHLIRQLSLFDNLRIVVSCRTYDLKTDPFLQSLDKTHIIEVGDLQEDEIISVLSRLGMSKNTVPITLLDLLKVPLHLKVFADIYHENMNFPTLKTLQDLYKELWERQVFSITPHDHILKAIETITDRMNTTKSLSVPFDLLDWNDAARRHLLSHSLLIEHDNQLQFFHQTFFDYCYARTFLSRYASLIEVILPQQGLFVRSQVKQVLNYLRGSSPQMYLKELQAFLIHPDLRFHLRLLVINQLAFVDDPTDEEWRIVKPLLDSDPEFTLHFLDAIQKETWLKYLIRYGYFHRFLTSSDDTLFGYTRWKLQSLIDTCTETIVKFLEDFPAIEKRDEQIGGILLNLTHWDTPKALQLFERYLPTIKAFPDSHHYYRLLQSVFPYQPERISQIFFEDLHRKIEAIPSADEFDNKRRMFDHEDIDLFEKIRADERTKDLSLSEGINIISQLVEKTKSKSKIEFYHDRAFLFFEKFGATLHNHWMFLALVKEQLLAIAQQDKPRFKTLVAGFQESYSLTLLKLLVQGYLTNPVEYVSEGLALLMRPGIFENMDSEESGGYEVRTLLNQLYSFFSEKQQTALNAIILSIKPDWERLQRKGSSMYRLLCAIPKDSLKRHPTIIRVYDELERKFGVYDELPMKVSEVIKVGPPLPEQAYAKMTPKQWLDSFKHYDESTEWDRPGRDFLKGGIVEHSRKFTEEVSKRAEEFYDFIFALGQRDDIPLMYLEAGINGLVKAQYDLEKVNTLVKTYWRFSDSGFRRAIIQALDYINKQDTLNLELIAILEEYVLHDPDPEQESWTVNAPGGTPYYGGDPIDSGINTVRGAAAWRLAIHGYNTLYPDKIFDIMEHVAHDPAVSVRCCLITNLQGMLNWDRERTSHLFIQLTHDLHPQIIKYGLPCLAYLLTQDNFHTFLPHLKTAMQLDEWMDYQHVQEYVGQILALAYMRSYPQSRELLEAGFQMSDPIKAGTVNFAAKQLLAAEQDVAEKSRAIYLRFLDEDNEELSRMYDHVFAQFEPQDFNKLYDLIVAYTQSQAAYGDDGHHFLNYLMKCVELEPEKCIDLIHNYLSFDLSRTKRRQFVRHDTHIRILIGAYNRLRDEAYKEKAMDIFDRMLRDQAYKREGLKVLEARDRS